MEENKTNKLDIEPQLPNTWKEFCETLNISEKEYFISDYYGVSKVHRIRSYPVPRDPKRDGNILPSKKAAEQHLALMKLHQLRDCYRGDWTPTLKVSDDRYGIGYFYSTNTGRIELSAGRCCCSSMFLTFPTLKLAEIFLTNFRELIEQAGDLI